ncbi:MAG: DegV family protein [Clostridia bacterium]|nr:DegV family protein [Clostridia bacterium]
MKIALSTESVVDLTKELIEKYDLHIIPYNVLLGEENKTDGEFSVQEIFDFVEKTGILPKTSAINEFSYTEYFQKLKEEYDAVIHISLSSKITSSTSHAISAAEKIENVFVIDSLSLSTGLALLAIYARELIDKGELSPAEIVKKVEERIPGLQVSFVIERLDYLHMGGRCSSIAFLGANLLKLRPQILVKEGKMTTGKKYKGKMEMVVKNYCNDVLKECTNIDKKIAFLTFSSATEAMQEIALKALTEAGFETIYTTTAGATITSHCGEHTLGIIFFNDGEH